MIAIAAIYMTCVLKKDGINLEETKEWFAGLNVDMEDVSLKYIHIYDIITGSFPPCSSLYFSFYPSLNLLFFSINQLLFCKN